ncbi:MAG: Dabb family protein [Ruminococcaceae bacterium]|nr:Dabb family protein [Oscillospiraceae bacterium]
MVKHIVMFKFLPEALGSTRIENVNATAKMLNDLQGKIPSLVASEVHINSECADSTNYDLVLISEFNDWQGLKEYIVHPLHVAVGQFIKDRRESRSCVDYEY